MSDEKEVQFGRKTEYEVCLHLSTGGFDHIHCMAKTEKQAMSKARQKCDFGVLQARIVTSVRKNGSAGKSGYGHTSQCKKQGMVGEPLER